MSELLDFYHQEVSARFSPIPWLAHLQAKALTDFMRLGFPARSLEDWKYTTVDAFLKQAFSNKETPLAKATAEDHFPAAFGASSISIINGQEIEPEAWFKSLPAGVVVLPLARAIVEHAEKIKPYLGRILQQQHGFQALNTALLHHGVFVYVPKDTCLTTPLRISHWQDNANQAVHLRHLVVLEPGSSATILEDYQGDNGTCYFTNTITEVSLSAFANLTHYKIQRESKDAFHIGHIAVNQAEASHFHSHSLSMGGKLVRSDLTIGLHERGAECDMNGIIYPQRGSIWIIIRLSRMKPRVAEVHKTIKGF